MDELNDLIAAMPDGASLSVEPGMRFEMSGPLRISGKRRLTIDLRDAVVIQPRGCTAIDFAGSESCQVTGGAFCFAEEEAAARGYVRTWQDTVWLSRDGRRLVPVGDGILGIAPA